MISFHLHSREWIPMYLLKSWKWVVGNQGSLLEENKNHIHSDDATNKKLITVIFDHGGSCRRRESSKPKPQFPRR